MHSTSSDADGATVPYDKLLLATGSKPLAPPIPGLDFANVRAFRDIADVEAMIEAARNHRRAVVIGGGLLGLAAAWGLKQRGMSVALVHLMPTLMERQLGERIEHNGQVFGLTRADLGTGKSMRSTSGRR